MNHRKKARKTCWLLPEAYSHKIPSEKDASFGCPRKYAHKWGKHTGIDMYAPTGSKVLAIEDGTIVKTGQFTGIPESPQWRKTYYVMVKHDDKKVAVYGELRKPRLKKGHNVHAGQTIGCVGKVLFGRKKKKSSMLHFELHKKGSESVVDWYGKKPDRLIDPTRYLDSIKKTDDTTNNITATIRLKRFYDAVQIKDLADNPKYVKTVSRWIWNEWGRKSGKKLKDIEYRTNHCLHKNRVPKTMIATYKNTIVGTVSLWQNDLNSRQDLTPWLAVLYVDKKYRGRGVGRKLQEAAIREAKRLGYPALYLITDHKGYYEKMHWKFLEKAPLDNGSHTRIYKIQLRKKRQ